MTKLLEVLTLLMLKWNILWELVNTIAADAWAPSIAESSASMVLTIGDEWVIVFHHKGI